MTLDLSALHAVLAPHKDPLFIVAISGGRDSEAASLALTEAGIEHERVAADTGWEHDVTFPHIQELTRALGPISVVHGVHKDGRKMTMESLVEEKGMFPSRMRRFCTVELKVKPLKRHVTRRAAETGRPIVNVIGIRRGESLARRDAPEVEVQEYEDGLLVTVWRPLVTWTGDDVREIHERHGLAWNPLYDMGATRVGCWPCINARKGELRLLGKTDPARVARISAMELGAKAKAAARAAAKGETIESLGHFVPTFFMQVGPKSEREAGVSWPIERVMEWAKTSRGGRQYDMDFTDDACVSLGLCEAES